MRNQLLAGMLLALLAVGVSADPVVNRTTDEFTGVAGLSIIEDYTTPEKFRAAFLTEGDKPAQLAIFVITEDWRFLGEEVFDDTQTKLRVISTDRQVLKRGGVMETVVLDAGEDWLANKLTGDTRIKVFGRHGTAIFTLSEKFKTVAYAELKAKVPKGDDATGE